MKELICSSNSPLNAQYCIFPTGLTDCNIIPPPIDSSICFHVFCEHQSKLLELERSPEGESLTGVFRGLRGRLYISPWLGRYKVCVIEHSVDL